MVKSKRGKRKRRKGVRHWGLYGSYRRCVESNGRVLCPACAQDMEAKPHGPYYYLKRSQPDPDKPNSSKQQVYVGRLSKLQAAILEEKLHVLDEDFPKEKPTKKQVYEVIGM